MFTATLLLAFAQSTYNSDLNFVNPHQDAIVAGDKAYIMLKPQFVQANHVQQLQWSSDGRYLLITWNENGPGRPYDPDAHTFVNLYDRTTGRCIGYPEQDVTGANFIGDTVLISDWSPVKLENGHIGGNLTVLRWSPPSAPVPIYRSKGEDPQAGTYATVDALEGGTYGFIDEWRPKRAEYLVTREAAAVIPLKVPDPKLRMFVDSKQVPYYGTSTREGFNAKYRVDVNTGELTPSDVTFSAKEINAERLPLRIDASKHKVSYGNESTTVAGSWLCASHPKPQSALIALESSQEAVSPALNAVAYEQSGVVFYRPIQAMPLNDFTAFVKRYDRTAALNRARQVGHATVMFCVDHDDHFPTAEEFSQVVNYLGDPDMLEGFHYSLNGQLATAIADPTTTVLGYIQLDGYQAIVYADTSCKLVPIK